MARFPALVKNDLDFSRLVSFLPDAMKEFHDDANKLGEFRRFSHLSAGEARTVLTGLRSHPWIDIKKLRINTSGQRAIGRFDPNLPNRIALSVEIARQFQQDHDQDIACETILATTLHECVHYGRAKKGIPDPNLPECGVDFERAIWGFHHGPWFDEGPLQLAAPSNSEFLFPVSGETGRRNHLYGRGVRNGGARDHHGIDIFHRGPGHPPVHAVADGVVIGGNRFRKGTARLREVGNYGQMIDLNHGNGLVTRYAHLNSVEVNPDQRIRQGDRIGTLGASGTERGAALEEGRPVPEGAALPHLHFEVLRAGEPPFKNFDSTLDPVGFFAFLRDQPEDQIVSALQPGDMLEVPARLPGPVELVSDSSNDFTAFRILRRGVSSSDVKFLQQRLLERGFDPGDIDGNFDGGTEAAVRAFQASEGLLIDGIAGRRTLAVLTGAALKIEQGPLLAIEAVTVDRVSQMFHNAPIRNIKTHLPLILRELVAVDLGDKSMVLMALATIRAETAGFEPISELMSRFNTSPNGHPFDLYDSRRDLGNIGKPDGANFKGRGFVQLTGRNNYQRIGSKIGLGDGLLQNPDLANDPDIATRILAAFLKSKETRIKQELQEGDLLAARKLVNGGRHGFDRFSETFRIGQLEIPDAV